MSTYTFTFRRESKSVFSKNDPDIQTMTVEAETQEEAVAKLNERWATNAYTVHIMKTMASEL